MSDINLFVAAGRDTIIMVEGGAQGRARRGNAGSALPGAGIRETHS